MNKPAITVLIVTFNRPKEIRQTIESLFEHLEYDGQLNFLVCDDSTPGEYLKNLKRDYPEVQFMTTQKNSGWGSNVNQGMAFSKDTLIYLNEDDYVLKKKLNLSPYAALLLENADYGLVRFDGLAGHKINASLKEYKPAEYDKIFFWELWSESPELWIYSNRPHLKHRRFHQFYGVYPEGLRLGETEMGFAHTFKDKNRGNIAAPKIICPVDWVENFYDDIGVSMQKIEQER